MNKWFLAYGLIAAIAVGQAPITISGSARLDNLTNPDAAPFVPGAGAPPSFLSAYGFRPAGIPVGYPSPPPGYNDVPGLTAQITALGQRTHRLGLPIVFYVLSDTGFVPTAQPGEQQRTLDGVWRAYDGGLFAPIGTLGGNFDLIITSTTGPVIANGSAEGSLTLLSATGTLAAPGQLGAKHRLAPPANAFPNWFDNTTLPGPTGGDIFFLEIQPLDLLGIPTTTPLAANATEACPVDLDLDGAPDLAFLDPSANSIAFLANDGSGVFLGGGSLPVAPNAVTLGAARINGDARPDLVIGHRNPAYLEFRFATGGGGFGPAVTLPLDADPTSIGLGDLTGDGIAEMVVAMPGNGLTPGIVRVFLNDGLGNFPLFVDLPGIWRPSALAFKPTTLAEVADLAIVDDGSIFSGGGPTISMWRLGGGIPVHLQTLPVRPGTGRVTIADMNGDLLPDVVTSALGDFTGAGGGVDLYQFVASVGYSAAMPLLDGMPILDIAAMDHDRDGRGDLYAVSALGGDLMLRRGWTGSGWSETDTLPVVDGTRLLGTDLNADGFPDVVTSVASTSQVTVHLSVAKSQVQAYGVGCPGSFGAVPIIAAGRTPGLGNPSFSVQVRNALPGAPALLFFSFTAADIPLAGPQPGCRALIFPGPPFLIPGTGEGQFLQITDGTGFAQVFLPIPDIPFLEGLIVYCQWAVIDPGAILLTPTPLALSGGMRLTLH